MHVPPYEFLLRQIGQERGRIEESDSVQISLGLFKLLLQSAVAAEEFDESLYLKAHSDVNDQVANRNFESAAHHYLTVGYFEGRINPTAVFDEQWYVDKYPNVLEEMKNNTLASAVNHYLTIGMQDGYAPNQKSYDELEFWKQVLGTPNRTF